MSGINTEVRGKAHNKSKGLLAAARLGLLVGLTLLAFSLPTLADPTAESLAGRLSAASIEILVDGRLAGSGWIAASQGLAVTAAHVVNRGHKIEVLTPANGRLSARVVAMDLGHDLALLKLERLGKLFSILQLSASPPRSGAPLALFGTALFRHGLTIPGSVASDHNMFEWNDVNNCYTEVQPVAAMAPKGLSGGPWVNAAGEVVGVQSTAMTESGALAGIAFMSPLKDIRKLVQEKSSAEVATLGGVYAELWEPTLQRGKTIGGATAGIRVLRILAGGPLDRSGVSPGEIVLTLDGSKLELRDQLIGRIRDLPPGSSHTLTVLGAAGAREVRVVLAPLGVSRAPSRARTP